MLKVVLFLIPPLTLPKNILNIVFLKKLKFYDYFSSFLHRTFTLLYVIYINNAVHYIQG